MVSGRLCVITHIRGGGSESGFWNRAYWAIASHLGDSAFASATASAARIPCDRPKLLDWWTGAGVIQRAHPFILGVSHSPNANYKVPVWREHIPQASALGTTTF